MSFLNDVIQILVKYHTQLLQGVGNTMLIALTATAAGLVIGLLTGVVRTAPLPHNPVLRVLHRLLKYGGRERFIVGRVLGEEPLPAVRLP